VQAIDGPWRVEFDRARYRGPAPTTFDRLVDWSEHPDEAVRHYAGPATYRATFDGPEAPPGRPVYLDLGAVKSLAEVELNGRPLGVCWKAPFRVDVTDALLPGRNDLAVTVVNGWPNRLIGESKRSPSERWTRGNGVRHYGPDDALHPSGLIGPVRLLAASDT
jgi:hypothetical protein